MKAIAALILAATVFTHLHKAKLISTHDGDTFTADIEIRPGLTERETIRLYCGNAAELKADGGVEARAALVDALGDGGISVLTSWKREKYGRLLADAVADGRTDSVCTLLRDGGFL